MNPNGAAETTQVPEIPVTEAPVETSSIPPLPPSAEMVPTTPPPAPSPNVGGRGPRKLEEAEIIKLENAFLKIDNLRKGKAILERDIQLADAHILTQQQQLTTFREQLSQKYGTDLSKARIAPDGTIIPGAATLPTNAAQNPIGAALAGR